MAFGVHQKVSHDISSAFGKGLHGLKVEAMANQRKPSSQKKGEGRRMSGRALAESVMLGVFTVTVAAIPVIVTRVPAPESLIIVKEILQDWCTPSVCFVVLIVGVMIATSGVWGSEPGSTPEQNHKKFADSYLTQGPVSATQSMPDIFFSADAARSHALNHSAAFPVRAPPPSSVMVPVYYPAFVPPQLSPFSHKFEPSGGDRFAPRLEERFLPRVDDRFSPRVDERFVPRLDGRFSPRGQDRFVPQAEERYAPLPDDSYVPRAEQRYVPQAEERYEPQDHDRFEADEEDTYEPEVTYEAHAASGASHDDDDDEAGSDSGDQGRYAPAEEAESERDDEVESEHEERYAESDADDQGTAEPAAGMRSADTDDEVDHSSREPHAPPQQSLPSERDDSRQLLSPPHSPAAPPPPAPLPSPQSYNAPPAGPDAEPPAPLLSRRRPPAVPTTAPPPAASEPVASPRQDPDTAVRGDGKEAPEISPRTPPKHASERRPLSSSSSRTYAEYVRRTSNFSPAAPLEPPRPPPTAPHAAEAAAAPARAPLLPKAASSPRPEAADASRLDERLVKVKANARRHSTGGSALMKQLSLATRRPREVTVVDDDKLDDEQLGQGPDDDDDVDQRVEAFLKNFREQMRLQRQESLQRHRRGGADP